MIKLALVFGKHFSVLLSKKYGCHCTVLMLWVVQAGASYFVFFSNQRNRPPTQLSCLKGSCMPLSDFGEGLIGVDWTH